VERKLVGEQRADLVGRLRVGLAGPGLLDLLAQLDRLEARELLLDMGEEALGRHARGDDRPRRAAREVDRVLQRDERPERVAEDDVALEPERRRERVDVAGVAVERPGVRRRRLRAPLRALVDEQQPMLVAERVETVAEHRVVEARPAVQRDEGEVAAAALLDMQSRVADVDQHGRQPSRTLIGR
jgi:hypothetical protein